MPWILKPFSENRGSKRHRQFQDPKDSRKKSWDRIYGTTTTMTNGDVLVIALMYYVKTSIFDESNSTQVFFSS